MIKKVFLILLLIFLVYSFFIEPNQLKIVNYKVPVKGLSGVRLVFVGDLHVKPTENKKLRKIAKNIALQRPDVIVSSGGFLNGENEKSSMAIEEIAKLLSIANYNNKFYVSLGDHDIDKKKQLRDAFSKYHINVLDNTYVRLTINGRAFNIAGINAREAVNINKVVIQKAIKNANGPVVLLSHFPDVFPEVPKNVNLILAGHTHGGQIVLPGIGPLILPVNHNKNYVQGLVEENGKRMIITRGIGTSHIHARFNCPPEIVVIDFK